MSQPDDPRRGDSILIGVGLAALLHIVCIPTLAVVVSLVPGADDLGTLIGIGILFIGFVQLVYMIPAWIVLWTKGRRRTAKGLAIVAALAFLVTGGCIAMFTVGGMRIAG